MSDRDKRDIEEEYIWQLIASGRCRRAEAKCRLVRDCDYSAHEADGWLMERGITDDWHGAQKQ